MDAGSRAVPGTNIHRTGSDGLLEVVGSIRLPFGRGCGSPVVVPDREPSVSPAPPHRLRVLFVCAMNQWRSPTAEQLYRKDPRLEVRSAGVRSEARRKVSAADLEWADIVMVMEREQGSWIRRQFRDRDLPRIEVLEIPDDFPFMDGRLQEALRAAITPEIEAILSGGGGMEGGSETPPA